jgi:hypothetical protein
MQYVISYVQIFASHHIYKYCIFFLVYIKKKRNTELQTLREFLGGEKKYQTEFNGKLKL